MEPVSATFLISLAVEVISVGVKVIKEGRWNCHQAEVLVNRCQTVKRLLEDVRYELPDNHPALKNLNGTLNKALAYLEEWSHAGWGKMWKIMQELMEGRFEQLNKDLDQYLKDLQVVCQIRRFSRLKPVDEEKIRVAVRNDIKEILHTLLQAYFREQNKELLLEISHPSSEQLLTHRCMQLSSMLFPTLSGYNENKNMYKTRLEQLKDRNVDGSGELLSLVQAALQRRESMENMENMEREKVKPGLKIYTEATRDESVVSPSKASSRASIVNSIPGTGLSVYRANSELEYVSGSGTHDSSSTCSSYSAYTGAYETAYWKVGRRRQNTAQDEQQAAQFSMQQWAW